MIKDRLANDDVLVIASGNSGKVEEFRRFLVNFPFKIIL